MSATQTQTISQSSPAATTLKTSTNSPQDPTFIPRGDATATFVHFGAPDNNAVPFNYIGPPPPGEPQYNYKLPEHQTVVHDVRGREQDFTLEKNAFATISGVSSEEKDFSDDEHIKNVYYPEVEKLLLNHVDGAQRIFLFDHTIRRTNPAAPRAPVLRAHIDQTPYSAQQRVELHMGSEAPELLQGRYRIINVWRPINGPVQSHPLAMADTSTVEDSDLVPIEHRYPERTGETAGVKFNPKTKWYYWSGMGNDERLFLQCFDSQDHHSRVPHTAFVDPRTPEGAVPRESIEVRALVFG
ncbi:MAG: hypothetical protein MMC33_009295 [Icmadophila ericetorum]|nr:hypothetical protein [Icmadophila ericetorum]